MFIVLLSAVFACPTVIHVPKCLYIIIRNVVIISGFDLLSQKLLQSSSQVERNHPYGWRLLHSFQGIQLSDTNATKFLTSFRGDFTLQFSGILSLDSRGILLLINKDKSLPYLEVALDILKGVLVFRYLGSRSFQRVTFENVYPKNSWLDFELSVHGKEATVTIDCQRAGYAKLKQKIGVIPVHSNVIFGGTLEVESGIKVCDACFSLSIT